MRKKRKDLRVIGGVLSIVIISTTQSGCLFSSDDEVVVVEEAPVASSEETPEPTQVVVTNSRIVAAVERTNACTLLESGQMWCWGENYFGQTGVGFSNANYDADDNGTFLPPVPAAIDNVIAIGVGFQNTCALLSDKTVKCVGNNEEGQLGNDDTESSVVPVSVEGLSGDVTAISTGSYHSCVILADKTVQCWGYNSNGQLGNGTDEDSYTASNVEGLDGDVTQISSGYGHTCALLSDKTVKCWGYGTFGQLGNNEIESSLVPVSVQGLAGDVEAIYAAAYHTCAVLTDLSVQCWGDNGDGQLGDGTYEDSSLPVPVHGLGGEVIQVAGGHYHTCALLKDKTVQCWGFNGYGQLGNDSTLDSLIPVTVQGLTGDVASIATGEKFSCAFLEDQTVQCWGGNDEGQLGNLVEEYSSVATPTLPLEVGTLAKLKIYAEEAYYYQDECYHIAVMGITADGGVATASSDLVFTLDNASAGGSFHSNSDCDESDPTQISSGLNFGTIYYKGGGCVGDQPFVASASDVDDSDSYSMENYD